MKLVTSMRLGILAEALTKNALDGMNLEKRTRAIHEIRYVVSVKK